MDGIRSPLGPPAAASWRSIGELCALLLGSWPGVETPPLLADASPDAGLFGPHSVTWRVAREPLLLLGGGRALLMQVAHPLVAQGVVDHSAYATDPFGRLVGTVRWLVAVTFGTTAEARAASESVAVRHRHVRGRLHPDNATGAIAAGTAYSAADAELARWVHATIVQSMLVTHDALVGTLDRAERDRLVREWVGVGALFGVDRHWDDAAALDAYVAGQIATLPPPPRASRTAARVVLRPPLPSRALRPAFGGVALLTAGLLDERLRRGFGVRWTRAHDHSHRAACASLRRIHPLLPRPLRISPLHDAALARCEGRGLTTARRAMVVR